MAHELLERKLDVHYSLTILWLTSYHYNLQLLVFLGDS